MYLADDNHPDATCDTVYGIIYFCVILSTGLLLQSPCAVAHDSGGVIQDILHDIMGFANEGRISDEMLVNVSDLRASDVIVDVGSEPEEYISGAIHIPYTVFLEDNNTLKSLEVVAEILGDAGISRDDSVVLYGECMPCGGGPSTSTFVYWLMRYAGHDRVRLLDGGLDAWKGAGRPTQGEPAVRESAVYLLRPRLELLANFSYVSSGQAQLIDARPYSDFMAGTIPGSVNIPYEEVANGDRLKSKSELMRLFSGVDRERPVVVYTTTGIKASVVWFALTSLGYDAKLYMYQDWYNHGGRIYSPASGLVRTPARITGGYVEV